MTALRTIVASSLGLVAAALSGEAKAAALTYYYVSAPYVVSNHDGEAPLFTTGYVTIDEARAKGGSIAGKRAPAKWPSYITDMEFRSGDHVVYALNYATARESFIQFDAGKRIADWEIMVNFDEGYNAGRSGERSFDYRWAGEYLFTGDLYTPGVKGCSWYDYEDYDCF